jgi:hypothetical protein
MYAACCKRSAAIRRPGKQRPDSVAGGLVPAVVLANLVAGAHLDWAESGLILESGHKGRGY